jgi:hypothetical protein
MTPTRLALRLVRPALPVVGKQHLYMAGGVWWVELPDGRVMRTLFRRSDSPRLSTPTEPLRCVS